MFTWTREPLVVHNVSAAYAESSDRRHGCFQRPYNQVDFFQLAWNKLKQQICSYLVVIFILQ